MRIKAPTERYLRWKNRTEIDPNRFCSFCDCDRCKHGPRPEDILQDRHAQTNRGDWICSTCYLYECCVDAGSEPCYDTVEVDGVQTLVRKKCEHRPVLTTGFRK